MKTTCPGDCREVTTYLFTSWSKNRLQQGKKIGEEMKSEESVQTTPYVANVTGTGCVLWEMSLDGMDDESFSVTQVAISCYLQDFKWVSNMVRFPF